MFSAFDIIPEYKKMIGQEPGQNPEDPAAVKQFQESAMELIRRIDSLDEKDLNSDILKAGIDLICKCTRTRISVRHSGGFETVVPVILPGSKRNFCAEKYDEWMQRLRSFVPGYIPDQFERCAPCRDKLLFLQKQYLSAKADTALKAHQESLSFNSLLGGRRR